MNMVIYRYKRLNFDKNKIDLQIVFIIQHKKNFCL